MTTSPTETAPPEWEPDRFQIQKGTLSRKNHHWAMISHWKRPDARSAGVGGVFVRAMTIAPHDLPPHDLHHLSSVCRYPRLTSVLPVFLWVLSFACTVTALRLPAYLACRIAGPAIDLQCCTLAWPCASCTFRASFPVLGLASTGRRTWQNPGQAQIGLLSIVSM